MGMGIGTALNNQSQDLRGLFVLFVLFLLFEIAKRQVGG